MFLTPSDFLLRYFKCCLFLGLGVIMGMCVNFIKKIIYNSYQKTRFPKRKISPCMSFISIICSLQFSSVAHSCSLQPHGVQHARLPCAGVQPRWVQPQWIQGIRRGDGIGNQEKTAYLNVN